MAADCKTARPQEFYRKFIEKDVRPDERNLEEFRPTVLNIGCIGTAEGSALVKLGNTTVMCGIKAEIASPKTEEPKKGYIVPNVELGPLCSPMFRPGAPGEQAQDLSYFMNEVLKHSCCIDTEELCIVPGKHPHLSWPQEKVHSVFVTSMDPDEPAHLGSLIRILAAHLPKVSWNEETDCLETDENKKSQLDIQCQPVSSTFAIFDDHILLVDPTVEEETLSTGEVTVVTVDDQLCIVRKPGGSALSPQQLDLCMDRAFLRSNEVVRLIQETMNSVDR